MAVVVADAVVRHGGIPELIPKTEDVQEEIERKKKDRRIERREKQERSNDRSAKKTTKMTLCGTPILCTAAVHQEIQVEYNTRDKDKSNRECQKYRQKEQDCRVKRKTDASRQSRNKRKALNLLRNYRCGCGRCGFPYPPPPI